MKNSKIKIKKGFTLVELLAIMVIIAVITAIGVPVYQSSSMKTKEKTFNIKIDNAHQSGKLWALDHLDCFKTDACSELITPVECVQGGSNDNDDCYVMSLNTLASEGYYDYDDNEGNILNPIDNSSMKDEQIMLVYNSKYGKVSDVPLNTYVYKILTFTPSAQRTQNHTVNISNLYDIASITSDNGTVTYEKNKNNINITIKNGDSVGTEWNPKLHSKSVTANRTSSNNSFANTYSYDDGEYTGTLNKDGVSAVISGEYIPEHRKNVTGQTSANYNSGGYTGTLTKYTHSGTYTPADTIFVTDQPSADYNKNGYSGTLTKYLKSGELTPSHTKTVTITNSLTKYEDIYCDRRNWWNYYNGTAFTWVYPTVSNSQSYSSGGYTGTLYRSGDMTFNLPNFSLPVNPCGAKGESARANVLYKYDMKGSVTKPASDTRVYRYRGNVTKPASDTRVYRYQGNVIKPALDTRMWQQNYSGRSEERL